MPIIRKLGWDGSDPEQVVPEYPANAEVAKARLPHTIASLKPELVSLNQDSVHITTVAYFDGGWGYFVPRTERGLPKLVERYEKVGQGIYWWHPY